LIVGEKKFTAQIIAKGFSHVFVRRRVSPKQVYTILENALRPQVLRLRSPQSTRPALFRMTALQWSNRLAADQWQCSFCAAPVVQ